MIKDTGVNYRLESVPSRQLDALTLRPGAAQSTLKFSPVLALTLTRSSAQGREVLVCVRDAQANVTHPDVLSSPTMRLTGLGELRQSLQVAAAGPAMPAWLGEAIAQLLVKKLDVPYLAAAGCSANRLAVWQAESIIGSRLDGSLVVEPLTMLNAHVDLSETSIEFPRWTADYSGIYWISEQEHELIVRQRDAAGMALPTGVRVPMVYGLCTKSTAAMLAVTRPTGELISS